MKKKRKNIQPKKNKLAKKAKSSTKVYKKNRTKVNNNNVPKTTTTAKKREELLREIRESFENELDSYVKKGLTLDSDREKIAWVFSNKGIKDVKIKVVDSQKNEFTIKFLRHDEVEKVLLKHYHDQKCIDAYDIVTMLDIIKTSKRSKEHDSYYKIDNYVYKKEIREDNDLYKVVIKLFPDGENAIFKSIYTKKIDKNKKSKKSSYLDKK